MDKIKNLPVFRLLAFAVALAIILGLSSVILSFTASAEDVVLSDLPVGTIGNYKALRVPISSDVHYVPLSQITAQSGNSSNVAIVGKCNSGYKVFCIFSIVADSNNCTLNGNHFLNDGLFRGSSSNFDNFALQIWSSQSNGYRNLFYQLSFKLDGADNYSVYVGWNGSLSDKFTFTDYYFIFGSYSNDSSEFVNDIENNISSDTDFKDYTPPPTGGSDNGRFTCFGNYTDYSYDEHLSDLISESIEYTKSVSYGNYGRGKCYFIKNPNDKDSFIFNRPESKQLVRYNSTDISFTFYNATDDLGACSIRLSATMPRFMERESDSPLDPIKFLSQHAMSYYHFNRIAVISSDSFKAIPAKSTVTATLDLTGFTSIAHSGYYLIELVNSISGDVVSSVMFDYENDGQSFKQSNDHIDVKYKYDNGNITPDVDLPPDDTGHINGIPDGGLDSSNNKYTFNYQNPNITDIFGTLDDSINSISDFFQMCFSLLPLAISTIIIGGFALLVLLRVLGR